MVAMMAGITLVFSCLGSLLGMGVGVLLIVRKRMLPGVLALIGFSLFGLAPIVNFWFFRC